MKSKKKRLEKELVSTLQMNFEGVFNGARHFFFAVCLACSSTSRNPAMGRRCEKKRFSKFCTNFLQHLHNFTAI